MVPRRTPGAILSALTAAAVLLAGCSQPAPSEEEEPVVLDVGATAEPVGLDPSTVSGAGTPFVLLYNVYETLVRLDAEGEIRPLLAQDWTVSPDNTTYTFNLDPQAEFASGTPVTAEAVITSYERVMQDEAITDQISSKMEPVEAIEAVDEDTVEITLSRPSNQWLYDMTGPTGIVYDPAGLEQLNEEPAGSGPFTFAEWDQGSHLKLVRNPDYWGTDSRVDEVWFRYYADPNAMNTAMLSGQLDIISNLTTPQSVDQFADAERFTVLEGVTDGEVVLGFNHRTEALSDLRVRQAIMHAIDREALLETVWGGKGTLIGSMVPPTDPWYEDLSGTYPYDPDRARELLAEAGYTTGPTLRLRVPNLPYGPTSGRFVAEQLRAVGMDIQFDELEFPARWLDLVYTEHDYDMTIVAHVEPRDIGNFADPDYYWGYDNPEFASLLEEADSGTPEEQVELMQEAARMLNEDAAANWLFLLPNLIITTTEVTGIAANATGLSFDLTSVATSD